MDIFSWLFPLQFLAILHVFHWYISLLRPLHDDEWIDISNFPHPEPVFICWSSVHWNTTGMPLVDPMYTGISLGDRRTPAGYTGTALEKLSWNCPTPECHWRNFDKFAYTGTPLEKRSWNCPTLGCHWRNSNFWSLHWNTTGGTVTAHTHPGTYN